MPLGTELAGDVVARAMAEEESKGLSYKHYREDDAYGCRRLGVDLSDEECVHNIIYACHEHGYYCGYSHRHDNLVDGLLGKKSIVFLFCMHKRSSFLQEIIRGDRVHLL